MPIELKVLSGALAGESRQFDQSVLVVGRQSGCDLRFHPQKDLDVSGRHAEIHTIQNRYALHDLHSTNGTFLNGKRLDAGSTAEVKQGDRIRFGASGPEAEFHVIAAMATIPSTEVRVAMAVKKQTAGLVRLMAAAIAVVVLGGASVFWYSNRQATQREAELRRLLAANDSMKVQLQAGLAQSGDTTLMAEVQQRIAGLRARLASASTDQARAQISAEIQENEQRLRRMMRMDLPTIFARNKSAVAITMSDFDGKVFAGTAFGVTPQGLLVTNRHNVVDPGTGARVKRIAVKFTDTRDWLPASVVSFSETDELALIRMDRPGTYPVVEGISGGVASPEGTDVAIIGYPSGMDTPMEGTGNDFLAKSTFTTGTIAKITSSVLQIDSYATHGSSGSPVFGPTGRVIGVVFGGDRQAGGKIVYAVPAERVAAFIPEQYRGIVRD